MLAPIAGTTAFAAVAAPAGDADHEEALIAAARADPRAFAPLYERYVARVYRYCYFRLGNRETAEDATAEVFLKAMAGLGRYRPGVFAAWLYTIARNVVTDSRRRSGRQGQDDGPTTPATGDDADEERLALLAAVAHLPEKQRVVIELQFAGWSGEEIAASLGTSPAAVKMARLRGVARLRDVLGRESAPGGTR